MQNGYSASSPSPFLVLNDGSGCEACLRLGRERRPGRSHVGGLIGRSNACYRMAGAARRTNAILVGDDLGLTKRWGAIAVGLFVVGFVLGYAVRDLAGRETTL